jgi:hypothetical protein
MKVSYSEDVASHTGPGPCAYSRKEVREALAGGRAGQVLSRERGYASGCRRRQRVRKATRNISISREMLWPRVVVDPEHARKLFAREPGDPVTGPGGWHQGPRCESQGSTTAMNGSGESDRPICTAEAIEQERVRVPLAENVEGRGLTKGNPIRQNKYRTQQPERSRSYEL